ncbi:MAG: ATP-binding protein [Acidobacteria bacterium]|uniref:ATP-binding protein n=1 Tax=Candidatus Polarisedimenticola svalbardensis TaxID=2886004 RepID=A0A8J6Y7N1_9BACT|nr:ATP-binding protein [Candidatus Polarisedimenticola svalbardensis]
MAKDRPPFDRSRLSLRRRTHLGSSRDAINLAVQQTMEHLGSICSREDVMADLEIVLREGLANAALHGNQAAETKSVFLRFYGSREQGLWIAIRDEGSGFDPDAVPDPRGEDRLLLHHGRGIFLMQQLVDDIEYRKGGTELLLYKAPPI